MPAFKPPCKNRSMSRCKRAPRSCERVTRKGRGFRKSKVYCRVSKNKTRKSRK